MRKSRYSQEQIIRVLRHVESGQKVKDVIREHGISEQTYYRWKSKFGGMSVSDAKRLKQLEKYCAQDAGLTDEEFKVISRFQ